MNVQVRAQLINELCCSCRSLQIHPKSLLAVKKMSHRLLTPGLHLQNCKIASQARPSGKRNYIWIRRFCKINCRPIQIFHWRWPKVDPKLILAANWVQIASWCHPGKCSATICMLSHSVTNAVTVTASKFFFTFLNTCQQLPSIICQFERTKQNNPFYIFIVKTSSQASKLR